MSDEVTWTWSNQRFSTTTTLTASDGVGPFTLTDEMRFYLGLVDLSSVEDIERYLES